MAGPSCPGSAASSLRGRVMERAWWSSINRTPAACCRPPFPDRPPRRRPPRRSPPRRRTGTRPPHGAPAVLEIRPRFRGPADIMVPRNSPTPRKTLHSNTTPHSVPRCSAGTSGRASYERKRAEARSSALPDLSRRAPRRRSRRARARTMGGQQLRATSRVRADRLPAGTNQLMTVMGSCCSAVATVGAVDFILFGADRQPLGDSRRRAARC